MKKHATVDAYIARAPKSAHAKLKQLRGIAKTALPKASEEVISYSMPGYKVEGKPVIWFAFFKNHFGIYVPPPVVSEHKEELLKYETSKSGVLFALDKPLPAALIKKLIKARLKKIAVGKWVTCSRGHKFYKTKEQPTCPVCWPGRYKKIENGRF